MSKIAAIVSSPRKNGNGAALVEKMAEVARANGNEVEVFYLNELEARGCQACMGCKKAGKCVRKDGLTPVLAAVAEADGIIVSTPDYFGQPCAQYRMFEDRLYGFLGPGFALTIPEGKKFAAVVTCMSALDTAQNIAKTIDTVLGMFMKMAPVGDVVYSEVDGNGISKDEAFALAAEIAGKF